MKVLRQERGWGGHFICANSCRFRRNTLLTCGEVSIVVSTVGCMETSFKKGSEFYRGPFEEIGLGRYYETMAFHADPEDTRYHDADVRRQVDFNSPWAIGKIDADDEANRMHEAVVAEIANKLKKGEEL